jgi:hypothetical protein
MSNGFIVYLNSLHNLSAGGSNALAESQALNPYFAELYEAPPISLTIEELLTNGEDRVIVLTGHAGDGKSTIALDVLKRLRKLPLAEPLIQPLLERETIIDPLVHIVKDMSELSAAQRQSWLREAFTQKGSWLIISNTGPLLQSLQDYGDTSAHGRLAESKILDLLHIPLAPENTGCHTVRHFEKPLTIFNLTRIDNAALGAKILRNLVNHSGWASCEACSSSNACPINLNRNALHQAQNVVEDRVRWMYKRIGAYEKRLTIRQMVAQLALSITGGSSCIDEPPAREKPHREISDGLENVLFSEIFFGNRGGVPWIEAESLEAIAVTRRTWFGGPVSVKLEREISITPGLGWANLPQALDNLENQWRARAAEASAVRWRSSLRRMAYIFGVAKDGRKDNSDAFLDGFLQSPMLRAYDLWQQHGKPILTKQENNLLRTSCLKVLLETYSGFSASQFIKNDKLYITLRRPDQAVIQPTQLVIKKLDFREFEFDYRDGVPILTHRPSNAELQLTLPLLDFIQRRDQGELGTGLSPIHQARLDRFRAELLIDNGAYKNHDEIELLRASLNGEIDVHVLTLDKDSRTLELYS